MVGHLEPLAIAANTLQSEHCRPDQVLVTFGMLYFEYSKLSGAENQTIKEALLSSISRRWEKADQHIFIAAIFLNPLLKTSLFSHTYHFTLNGLYNILSGLWARFTGQQPPMDFHAQIQNYINGSEVFYGFDNYTTMSKQSADAKVLLYL